MLPRPNIHEHTELFGKQPSSTPSLFGKEIVAEIIEETIKKDLRNIIDLSFSQNILVHRGLPIKINSHCVPFKGSWVHGITLCKTEGTQQILLN